MSPLSNNWSKLTIDIRINKTGRAKVKQVHVVKLIGFSETISLKYTCERYKYRSWIKIDL